MHENASHASEGAGSSLRAEMQQRSVPAGTPRDLSVCARSETFPFWDPVSSLREEGAGLE